MYDEYRPPTEIQEWAVEAARSTRLVGLAWKLCFALAALALVLGLVAAVSAFLYVNGQTGFGSSSQSGLAVSQASNALVNALLPTGVLVAAGAFLRLSVTRFEVDLADGGDDDAVEAA